MLGADRCLRLLLGALITRPSRISSSSASLLAGISFSSRNEPLILELRMLLPMFAFMERLELGRMMMSTSSEASASTSGGSTLSFDVC